MACWHLAHNFWILFQQEFFHSKRSSEYFWGHRYLDAKLGAYIFHIVQVLPLPVINNATLGAQQATPVHLIMCPLLVTAGHLLSATMLAQISRMTFPTACYHLVWSDPAVDQMTMKCENWRPGGGNRAGHTDTHRRRQ